MTPDWPSSLSKEKLYYSIGELSDAIGLQQSTLRYWEDEFDRLDPDHSPGGQRRYRENDVETVLKIRYLLREEKFKIEGARTKLKNWNSFHSSRMTVNSIQSLCEESIRDIQDFVESL